MRKNNRAFSLVELSIVLVILGLLVGGILAGQSLIRASELRSVSADLVKYQTALNAFRDKYFALPGDMPNATRFWGAQAGSTTTEGRDTTCAALTTPATGTATCNGNGDGYISYASGTNDTYERYRLWQQLANAGMVEGTYAGVNQSGTGYSLRSAVPGFNVPASRISNVGYTLYSDVGTYQFNYIAVGAPLILSGTQLETASIAFKNEEVWNLDKKMDDGKPLTGKIKTPHRNFFGAMCPTSAATDSDYDLAQTGIFCWFSFYPL